MNFGKFPETPFYVIRVQGQNIDADMNFQIFDKSNDNRINNFWMVNKFYLILTWTKLNVGENRTFEIFIMTLLVFDTKRRDRMSIIFV